MNEWMNVEFTVEIRAIFLPVVPEFEVVGGLLELLS
jgi:hypothetical protein